MRQRSFRKQDSLREPDAILEQDAVGYAHLQHDCFVESHVQHYRVGYADAKHDEHELGYSDA
jgi:hypothetical protein